MVYLYKIYQNIRLNHTNKLNKKWIKGNKIELLDKL